MNSTSRDQYVELLADLLANCHDWDAIDPKSEFLEIALGSEVKLSTVQLAELFERFDSLDSELKFSPDFDHKAFVRASIPS